VARAAAPGRSTGMPRRLRSSSGRGLADKPVEAAVGGALSEPDVVLFAAGGVDHFAGERFFGGEPEVELATGELDGHAVAGGVGAGEDFGHGVAGFKGAAVEVVAVVGEE